MHWTLLIKVYTRASQPHAFTKSLNNYLNSHCYLKCSLVSSYSGSNGLKLLIFFKLQIFKFIPLFNRLCQRVATTYRSPALCTCKLFIKFNIIKKNQFRFLFCSLEAFRLSQLNIIKRRLCVIHKIAKQYWKLFLCHDWQTQGLLDSFFQSKLFISISCSLILWLTDRLGVYNMSFQYRDLKRF